jgi:hypothetical protein
MSISNTLTLSWARGSETLSKSVSDSSEGALDRDVTVSNGVSNREVALEFTTAGLSAIYIVSDQDVTLETNDGTSPDDTFTLSAGKPFVWFSGCGWPCPFTEDVTALFITNASGATANVQIRGIADATP